MNSSSFSEHSAQSLISPVRPGLLQITICLIIVAIAACNPATPTATQTPTVQGNATTVVTASAATPAQISTAVETTVSPLSVNATLAPTAAVTGAATANVGTQAVSGIVYKFGLTPWQAGQTQDDIRRLYKPMIDYLDQQLGVTFVIVSAKDYQQSSDFLAGNTVQFASISPLPFILAQQKTPGIKMLLTELDWNADKTKKIDSYIGYILALKTRTDINSVDDLKGKAFGFVSKESTSGYLVPNVLLLKAKGIDYTTYFSKVFFPGSHPLVTDAIAEGSIDAGATWDFNWQQAIAKHGDIYKAIWTSPPIPNVGIAVNPSVPQDIQDKVQSALLTIDPQLLQGLNGVGFVVRPDSFYDVIRQLQASQ